MEITIGTWIIPLIITICCVLGTIRVGIKFDEDRAHYLDFGTPFIYLVTYFVAIVVSLASWLVWALFK